MNKIKLQKNWTHLIIVCIPCCYMLGYLIWLDRSTLIRAHAAPPKDAIAWPSVYLMNALLLSSAAALFYVTLRQYLAIYTEEGIKWFSLSGYKLLRWSEVTFAEERDIYTGRGGFVIAWPDKRIFIPLQILMDPFSVGNELRSLIPPERWKQP